MKNFLVILISLIFSSFLLSGQTNVALFKDAVQSSNQHAFDRGWPVKAVDGNTNGNYGRTTAESVTSTRVNNQVDHPWWQVDLGAVYDITTIKLYNRTDCCAERWNGFKVSISTIQFEDNLGGTLYTDPNDIDYTNNPVEISSDNMRGRYVRVFLDQPGVLSLAEVKVFGTIASAPLQIGDEYDDGIIFSLDAGGRSGLICSPDNLVVGSVLGGNSGGQNMDFINATEKCSQYNSGGWRLPTSVELQKAFDEIGNFYGPLSNSAPANTYWSSSTDPNEDDQYYGLTYPITTPSGINLYDDYNYLLCRAVKAFTVHEN